MIKLTLKFRASSFLTTRVLAVYTTFLKTNNNIAFDAIICLEIL